MDYLSLSLVITAGFCFVVLGISFSIPAECYKWYWLFSDLPHDHDCSAKYAYQWIFYAGIAELAFYLIFSYSNQNNKNKKKMVV